MDEKRNLQDVLRRYPADRQELIALLRLSVDLGGLGRVQDGVRVMNEYDSAVTQFNRSIAASALDNRTVDDLSRFMDDREARADASLKQIAGSLAASGDRETAAAVSRTQSHVDQTLRGSKRDLQARSGSQSADQKPKPAGGGQERLNEFAAPGGKRATEEAGG